MRPSSQEPSVKMLGDAMKGIPAEAASICGTASASAGMRDTELPNPALNSAWSAGSLAQPGSVRFQGDSTPAAKGEVVVVPQSVDDGQVVKIVQVGETAVGTRKASSTASSMLFCGKTNESKTNEFSMSFEVELTTVTEAEHVERGAEVDATGVGRSEVSLANLIFLELCQDAVANRDGLTSMKLDVDLTEVKPYSMAATRAALAR